MSKETINWTRSREYYEYKSKHCKESLIMQMIANNNTEALAMYHSQSEGVNPDQTYISVSSIFNKVTNLFILSIKTSLYKIILKKIQYLLKIILILKHYLN